MKLGCIDYLNCYPFYYRMLEFEPVEGVEIVPAYPSDLNRMIQEGMLDMSPVSAAAYTNIYHDTVLLPDICLSSVGYVRSVILISRTPIEDLHHKKVGLSSASKTSVILLKMLLQKYYGIDPVYMQTDPYPRLEDTGCDAALVIGNEAMQAIKEPYVYDLGDLWLRKTGYPVVFAVFALRKDGISKYFKTIESVIRSYHDSLMCLDTDRERLIQKACRKYPSISYDIDAYYRVLEYRFTPLLKDALDFYLDIAGETGLLDKVGSVNYFDPQEYNPCYGESCCESEAV